MPESFTISRRTYSDSSAEALQQEIRTHTGDQWETESILRSMERFGSDESIQYYEVIPQASARTRNAPAHSAWTVRAVR